MSQTTSKRSTERSIGRKCEECGDNYQAVVVDESGRTIREGCGCRVEIVPSRIGDIDRLINSRRDLVGLDAERARADGGSDR